MAKHETHASSLAHSRQTILHCSSTVDVVRLACGATGAPELWIRVRQIAVPGLDTLAFVYTDLGDWQDSKRRQCVLQMLQVAELGVHRSLHFGTVRKIIARRGIHEFATPALYLAAYNDTNLVPAWTI
ncbi:hypothetical protein ACN47E_001919 [Coniothyrium glycines]